MIKQLGCFFCVLLLPSVVVAAQDADRESEPKIISGMSIVGNKETSVSLYLVPWSSSDTAKEVSFTPTMLNEELVPIDKGDFIRKLELYRHRSTKNQ